MVVTATRYEKRDVDVPASTTVLTGQELKDTGANNLGVALIKSIWILRISNLVHLARLWEQ